MSNPDDLRHLPASAAALDSLLQFPVPGTDLRVPLHNLSTVRARMDTVQRFLSDKVNANTLIGDHQMSLVSSEIAAAIHQVIVNGAALLACSQLPNTSFQPLQSVVQISPKSVQNPNPNVPESDLKFKDLAPDLKLEEIEEDVEDKWDIIELDAVELLAEHVHFCEICGKGFKRDANLRMHMRAHGNQFKTHEALLKPEKSTADLSHRRFSCPFTGCNRNKNHKKFRPLKSVICVKNHFKRSHCPKMYSCNRCNKKSFSVVADLKSHMKHCGETKWKCSCGTSFSRKDKLFGHMALFEGHMPAIMEDEEESREIAVMVEDDETEEIKGGAKEFDLGRNGGANDNGFFDGLLDGFDSIENFCLQDVLGGSGSGSVPGSATGMDWFL